MIFILYKGLNALIQNKITGEIWSKTEVKKAVSVKYLMGKPGYSGPDNAIFRFTTNLIAKFSKKTRLKLLLIEDEQSLCDTILNYFTEEGSICEVCGNLKTALEKIAVYDYDCILLDIGLPDGDGFAVLEYLKAAGKNECILIISARNSLDDKIKGLNIGADDYITKPFHLAELKARVMAIFRRKAFGSSSMLNYNEISVDLLGRNVSVNDKVMIPTRKEYDLLLYFMANKGKVISKNAIAEHLWGDEMDMLDSFDFIYTHIKNLRKKMMELSGKDFFATIYGVGYKFI
jgi:DNA-binding response OmpR family regulator